MNVLFENKWIRVLERDTKPGYTMIDFGKDRSSVMVLPYTVWNFTPMVLMLKMYRPTVDEEWWELPGGMIDPGEKPVDAAIRELQEETGLGVDTYYHKRTSTVRVTPSMMPPVVPIGGLTAFRQYRFHVKIDSNFIFDVFVEESEGIKRYKWMTDKEINKRVNNGEISDGVTLSTLTQFNALLSDGVLKYT